MWEARFTCENCGHIWCEKVQIVDAAITSGCPLCGTLTVIDSAILSETNETWTKRKCGYSFSEIPTTTTEPRPTEEPTPVATAEAAREELEKFAAWIEAEWFDNVDTPNEVVEAYMHDVRNGWKPEATDG